MSAPSFDPKDLITFGLALVGAVLGIINTWRAINHDKPRVKVLPKRAIPFGDIDERINFCIEAINLSTFALTITEMGILHRGTESRTALRSQLTFDNGSWPRRLEPRSSVTVYAQSGSITSEYPIRCAYAKTDCGLTFKGTSGALKQLAKSKAQNY
jgi:hypothetical protein